MMKPLNGIRVLDLTRLIPGPFCTMILADLGAEVIKIEEPVVGDYERQIKPLQNGMAYRFMLLNRNKKSLGINLKEEAGRKIFIDLAQRSDVVVEGFRPGAMARLGLAYDDLKKVNQRLVYCSLNSYGYSGPYSDLVAHDINILAQTGLLDLTGPANGPPVIPGVQLVDTVTALYAVIGIQAALSVREKTGKGQHIDLSMHDCAFSLMFDSARYPLGEGRAPKRSKERLMGGLAGYSIYESKDGKYMAIGAIEKKFYNTLLRELGLEAYIEKDALVTAGEVNPDKEEALRNVIKDTFKRKTLQEWQEILEPANVFFSPVNTIEEALADPQLISRQMVVETEHPIAGKYVQIGSPLKLNDTPVDLERLPAPTLGENTEEILKGLGFFDKEISDLVEKKIICIKN